MSTRAEHAVRAGPATGNPAAGVSLLLDIHDEARGVLELGDAVAGWADLWLAPPVRHVMFRNRAEFRRAVHGLRARGYRFVTVSELMAAEALADE